MNRLKELRKKEKLTLQQLADYAGVSKSTYYYWETGQYEPDQQMLIKLANRFRVSVDYILGRTDNITDKKIVAPELNAKSDQYYLDIIHDAGISDEQANRLTPIDLARVRGYVEGILETKKNRK